MLRILGRKEAGVRALGTFFKAMVQAVLLFGFDTWVMTPKWDGFWEGSRRGCTTDWW